MIQNILIIVDIAVFAWLAAECYRVHKLTKKAGRLIEEMEREINGGKGKDD